MSPTPLRRVLLFGNSHQIKKSLSVSHVLQKLQAAGADLRIEAGFARFLQSLPNVDVHAYKTCTCSESESWKPDFAISMGGDGTFLRTAACVGSKGVPILGVNTGHLGFLADVMPDGIDQSIECLMAGHYVVEQRSLLRVEKSGAPLGIYPYALNEVAVLKHDNSALINVTTEIDGDLLANYVADGLIVCTPTGSTGYSLSTGGPIISPDSQSFCISAVAPHSLSVRPVILNDDVTITLHVHTRSHKYLLAIDGRSETLSEGDTLRLRRAEYSIGVIKVKHLRFFDTLRDKMSWGADQRFN